MQLPSLLFRISFVGIHCRTLLIGAVTVLLLTTMTAFPENHDGTTYEPLPDVQHCLTILDGGDNWDGLRNSCSVHIHFFYCYPNPRNSTNIRHGRQCGTNERDDDQPYYTGRWTVPRNGGMSFFHWADEYHYAVCHNDVINTGGKFVSDDEGNYGCYSR